MYILIMRHGQAESGMNDDARALSASGKAVLDRYLPRVADCCKAHIQDYDTLSKAVLCSPKLRAKQTAAALAAELDIDNLQVRQELERYSLEPVLDAALASEADVVFLVGHEPMCSEWTAMLTGSLQYFSTAAIACMEMSRELAGAELVFFIQSSDYQF